MAFSADQAYWIDHVSSLVPIPRPSWPGVDRGYHVRRDFGGFPFRATVSLCVQGLCWQSLYMDDQFVDSSANITVDSSDSEWVNIHRSPIHPADALPPRDRFKPSLSVDRSSASSSSQEEGEDISEPNQPLSEKNSPESSDQQSLVSRLWNRLPPLNPWGGNNQTSVDVDQTDKTKVMATNIEEQKKPGGRKKPKSSRTGIMQFVKAKWKSEDALEDSKVLQL